MGENGIFHDRGKGYGLFLQEYNGNYKITAGKQKNGKEYLDWCWPQEWSYDEGKMVKAEKVKPVNVYLGNKDSAVHILTEFLQVLRKDDPDEPAF